MSAELLFGLVAVGGGAWWLMASGSREPPRSRVLTAGDLYRAATKRPEHDGKGRA